MARETRGWPAVVILHRDEASRGGAPPCICRQQQDSKPHQRHAHSRSRAAMPVDAPIRERLYKRIREAEEPRKKFRRTCLRPQKIPPLMVHSPIELNQRGQLLAPNAVELVAPGWCCVEATTSAHTGFARFLGFTLYVPSLREKRLGPAIGGRHGRTRSDGHPRGAPRCVG